MDKSYCGDVVVFDLDDTLVRERDFCRSGFRVIRRRLVEMFGAAMLPVAMRMDTRLRRRLNHFALLEEILRHYVADDAALRELMKSLVEEYRSHRPDSLPAAPGVLPVLRALKERGVPMALLTDGRSVTQRRKIEALGLCDYIDARNIVISEEIGADKLTPAGFLIIERHYPRAGRFIYVADNPHKDFLQPNRLGWLTCRVPYDADNVHPDTSRAPHGSADSTQGNTDSPHGSTDSPHGSADSTQGSTDSPQGSTDSRHGESGTPPGGAPQRELGGLEEILAICDFNN